MMHRALVALLVLVATVAVAPAATAQRDVYAVDAEHPLASQQAIDEYERDGVVEANLTQLDVGLALAEQHDTLGIDGFASDFNNQFLCIQYREQIARTLRLYMPSEYLHPRTVEMDSLVSPHTARAEPTAGQNHTALVVAFDGPARACFAVSKEQGVYFGAKDWATDVINRSTGWSPPSVAAGDTQWTYPDEATFTNGTLEIDTNGSDMTLQYDDTPTASEPTWLAIPDCDDPTEQAVCRFRRDGAPETVVLLDTDGDPPPIRYREGDATTTDLRSWGEDLGRVPERIMETVGEFVGGVL